MVTASKIIRLNLKVVPGAARDEIAGWLGDALKLRVAAAPERGKANAAVVALLARALGVPEARVRIVAGETSARKVVEIEGFPETELRQRLERAASPMVDTTHPGNTRSRR